jgi:hypothetical protein
VFLVGGSARLKVLGFGRPLPRRQEAATSKASGTYERLEGSSQDDEQARDLRAVGVLAYHCLTGQSPFLTGATRLTPVSSLYPAASAEFDGWFQQALSEDPEVRFTSAKMMAETFHVVAKATTFLGAAAAAGGSAQSDPSLRPARPSFVFEVEPGKESQSNLVAAGKPGPASVTGLSVVEVDATSADSRDDRNRG